MSSDSSDIQECIIENGEVNVQENGEESGEVEEEYDVEAIIDWRYNLYNQRIEYLIKWVNWDDKYNSWEPEEYLTNCNDFLKSFKENLSEQEKRCFFCQDHSQLNGFQRKAKSVCIGADRDKHKPEKIIIFVKFEDSDVLEKFDIYELHQYSPGDAFQFFEDRLLLE